MSIQMNDISLDDKLCAFDAIVVAGLKFGLGLENAKEFADECYSEAFGRDHRNALAIVLELRQKQGKTPVYADMAAAAAAKEDTIPVTSNGYALVHAMWNTDTFKRCEAQAKAAAAPEPKGPEPVATITVDPAYKQALNSLLSHGTSGIVTDIEGLLAKVAENANRVHDLEHQLEETQRRLSATPVPSAVSVAAHGAIPNGRSITVKAVDMFIGPSGQRSRLLDFDMFAMEWDAPHPHVPMIDPDYVFQPAKLAALLWAILGNRMPWLHGHSGSGKTTLVEQVCARLNLPFYRINMDSEIGRLDLVGRETLVTDPATGSTISKFVDGILPQAMQGPGVLCADEVDFIRPDVSYVMQRFLEDKGLLLTEDGGRLVTRHPLFRYVATANTRGQGDEYGVYMGARPQSAAFLDRHRVFIEIDYLGQKEEATLLKAKVPALDGALVDQLCNLAVEIRQSFKNGEIMQIITPRGLVALGESYAFFSKLTPNKAMAMGLALDMTVLGKATTQDAVVIRGLVNRVVVV